jgi:glucose-1-phosphatase
LGGVVFNYSFEGTFNTWSKFSGIPAGKIRQLLTQSESFERFERNDISVKEFIENISQLIHYKLDENTFEAGWNSIYLDLIGDIDNVLINLKTKYRLVALTNTNTIHAKVWTKKYSSTLQHFEKVFSSHEIHARKPEERAFQIVLDYLKLLPQETIFLDDKEKHIEGAGKLGINTILVTSFDQMILDLKLSGIQIVQK